MLLWFLLGIAPIIAGFWLYAGLLTYIKDLHKAYDQLYELLRNESKQRIEKMKDEIFRDDPELLNQLTYDK